MKFMEMMNYNYENAENKLPVHTEIGKKLLELNKLNDMNRAWLSCSEEIGARAIAENYSTYEQEYTESRHMVA